MLLSNSHKYGLISVAFINLILAKSSWGADLNQLNNQELINQQQAITEQLNKNQPFRPTKIINAPTQQTLPMGEKPCFIIQQVDINTPNPADKKHFITILDELKYGSQSILGQCIGHQGLIYINNQVQNKLIEQGFITSQSTILNQDISTKRLVIRIIPGKFNQAWLSPDSSANTNLYNSLIPKKNQILKLPDIETSLDNLRLPNGVEANLSILPSQQTANNDSGYSDLVVSYKKNNLSAYNLILMTLAIRRQVNIKQASILTSQTHFNPMTNYPLAIPIRSMIGTTLLLNQETIATIFNISTLLKKID